MIHFIVNDSWTGSEYSFKLETLWTVNISYDQTAAMVDLEILSMYEPGLSIDDYIFKV